MKLLIIIPLLVLGIHAGGQIQSSAMQSERYQKGWEKLREIEGKTGEKVIESLQGISPDLGMFIVEYAYGDIYTRNALDLKSREIAVVAALTAMGNAEPQLKVHINGALNTGSSINELKEVILQMSVYAGFPKAMNGMNALKEVLHDRQQQGIKDKRGNTATKTKTDRIKLGEQEISKLDSQQVEKLKKAYQDFSPDLIKFILGYGYADIFARDNLDKKYRQIATISALTALGTAQPQLKFHIYGGLNIGLTENEIKEIMLMMTVYSGFPSAINGINVLKEVLAEREKDNSNR
ncbi:MULTISPECIES: carboxymuconolactone decarboxylase family protein [Chryseobacterium]|uniref:4-carboxymuconolactone decarboxylase n=1 Tax=Chryseobacterium camelliae TaxID=1265445 RepID=A0ABU0TMY6_9FLAO|nr:MULTISPECIES: carboxymuconolactone decarboxylase family protein [Chryseobacterium]MDT3408552.1 4-carboxymuconolactone decarboxylase [Pseudacidovorax intermedius]MDQ1097593.1 4-carboxymuconolactone decarboxylase [Chryseobacterium camelliae]MDQ1101522.1 4-carboxymuconolactone decarboxylase [Chryseobacterium sp. SORGH_AS_1048]MDR6084965.1 4-carboxymuconolactone decarboxylase [Chryseobacterium sp. SORGH_AS_0909]MDR6129318.1 4-carboxymuconolactone decarboxylase [Chryseobacterium sp. SORGH_AS_117